MLELKGVALTAQSERRIAILIVIIGAGLLVMSVAAPLFQLGGYSELASRLYYVAGFLCHQDSSRSFFVLDEAGSYLFSSMSGEDTMIGRLKEQGYPFAVCARDFGTYLGMTIASLFLLSLTFMATTSSAISVQRTLASTKVFIQTLFILVTPIMLDVGMQFWTSAFGVADAYDSGNLTRALTGLLFGTAVSIFVVAGSCFGLRNGQT